MNIDECIYSVMLTFPKNIDSVSGHKASHVFANITPNFRYSKTKDEDKDKAFTEACKKVMHIYKDAYMDMKDGYKYVIVRLPFKSIRKYGTPIFVSTDRVYPDRYVSYTVEQAREYAINKKDSIDKKKEERIKGMRQKRNEKRRNSNRRNCNNEQQ